MRKAFFVQPPPAAAGTLIQNYFAVNTYTGNGGVNNITTGFTCVTETASLLVARSGTDQRYWYDSLRSPGTGAAAAYLSFPNTIAESAWAGAWYPYGTTGYTLDAGMNSNQNTVTYVGYTFRAVAGFFDIVTYTGDGGASKTIAHSIGSTPGMIVVRGRSTGTNMFCWHTSMSAGNGQLWNTTAVQTTTSSTVAVTAVTASDFTVDITANANGVTYVAYIWAHDTGVNGLVQCGTYTGNGSATGPTVTLGWEPQFVLIKARSTSTTDWVVMDNVRSTANPRTITSALNLTSAEATTAALDFISTGFQQKSATIQNVSGTVYLYMAVRKGPM